MFCKFYGTRGVFPTSEEMVSLILKTNTEMFLIDVGSSNIFQDNEIIDNVSCILISHIHHDHIAMLPHFIIARYHRSKILGITLPKCTVVSPEPLTFLLSSMGLEDLHDYEYFSCVSKILTEANIEQLITNHPVKNYCYRIQSDNHSIVYIGDPGYFSGLSEFCTGADLVICEASYSDESHEKAKKWGHMTPTMVARLIDEAYLRRVILTHFVELEPLEFADSVRKKIKWSAKVTSAFTGMEISIP